jgi:enamine deaminase RidA (YjgF/YER057c/UK114 family)
VDLSQQDLLFLAGQTGNVPDGKDEPVVAGGIGPQTKQALENLLAVVERCHGGCYSFVSMDVFLKDGPDRTGDREAFNAAYKKFFADHGVSDLPARMMVWVAEVPLESPKEDTLVEIRAVAAIEKMAGFL